MPYEVLVAIADTPANRTIEEDAKVELIGRFGIVQARVEVRIVPDGVILQDIMLHLRIGRDAAAWQLDGVETLRRFDPIVQTPVLEFRRLR